DPNLTRVGPKIEPARQILAKGSAFYAFSPAGKYAVFQDGTAVKALPLDRPEATPVEVARFDNSPWSIYVAGDDLSLLAQEGVPERPGVKSSGDPMKVWWVDGPGKEKKLLCGPEKDLNLGEFPLSPDPDRRFVLMQTRVTNPDGGLR